MECDWDYKGKRGSASVYKCSRCGRSSGSKLQTVCPKQWKAMSAYEKKAVTASRKTMGKPSSPGGCTLQ